MQEEKEKESDGCTKRTSLEMKEEAAVETKMQSLRFFQVYVHDYNTATDNFVRRGTFNNDVDVYIFIYMYTRI